MTEFAGTASRFAQAVCLILYLGTALLALLAGPALRPEVPGGRRLGFAVLALAIAAAVGSLVQQAVAVSAGVAPVGSVFGPLLLESRFGAVWLLRQGLLLAAVAVLALVRAPRWALVVSAAAVAANLFAWPASGHSAALEPAWPTLLAHGLHVVAAGAWLGALIPMAWLLRREDTEARTTAPQLFARFSRVALVLMAAIVGTGAWLAIQHVERWPALFGTRYGALVLAKVAVLAVILRLAAEMRWRLLPALASGASPRAVLRWLGVEAALAFAVLALASTLGQTIPARHDAVAWLLPFRVSIDATWDQPGVPVRVFAGAALAVLFVALLWNTVRPVFAALSRRVSAAASVLCLGAGAALTLHALSVPAYPDTYRTPSVPYQTVSVARGAELYVVHCAKCHGTSGHGDGPLARTWPAPPADLTEPHTALHTAGDIFWWLTHGKMPGMMPSVADHTSEDDRWDLINYIRTLSSGYQARILTERIVPGRPWLGAIDFGYATADGVAGTLQDHRGQRVVLLVFYREASSAARLVQLAEAMPRLLEGGATVLAVPLEPTGVAPFPRGCRACSAAWLTEGAAETAQAYALLRRTLTNPDPRDRVRVPEHMEFLVDRFGYLRARWIPGEGAGWCDLGMLLREIRALAAEPQILPPPDDHVH